MQRDQDVRVTKSGMACQVSGAERYEIDVRPAQWGVIRWAVASDGLRPDFAGRRCFSVLRGRDCPCLECPARGCAGGGRATSIFRRTAEPLVLELVSAETRGADAAQLSVLPMDSGMLSALLGARIDALCERASVTPRERAVVDMVTMGRAQKDIAQALRITVRTVKYHEANVQRKLGADSRMDLMRVLL